ncbi:MAG: SxtJ family membrane protein [Tannerellaceae bacterium]|jgi:hypothetical protein|nr:SxtJ family membrane protein [Tannerellaceae bacterium]
MRNIIRKIATVFSEVTKQDNMGFGLVAILVAAIYASIKGDEGRIIIAIVIISFVSLLCPSLLTPLSVLWHALSKALGRITTPAILGLTYLVVITPIGLIQRILKNDNMQARQFGKSKESTLKDRNHEYTDEDFINTF